MVGSGSSRFPASVAVVTVLAVLLCAAPSEGRPLRGREVERTHREFPQFRLGLRGGYGGSSGSDFDHTWPASLTLTNRLTGPLDYLLDVSYVRGAGLKGRVPADRLQDWPDSACPECGLYYEGPDWTAVGVGIGLRLNPLSSSGQAGPYLEAVPTFFTMFLEPNVVYRSLDFPARISDVRSSSTRTGIGWQLRAGTLYRVGKHISIDLGWQYQTSPDFKTSSFYSDYFSERGDHVPGGLRGIAAYSGITLNR